MFEPGDHASTYGGNPFACGVALAVCETIGQAGFLENVQARGNQLRDGLTAWIDRYPDTFSAVRGWGLINGLVIQEAASLTSIDLVKAAMAEGLLLVPAGPKVVRFVPPLIVTAEEVDTALSAIGRALVTAIG